MIPTPAIEFERVSFAYDDHIALGDLTLSIPAGSFTALAGPNSSGKSTTLKLMSGILPPRQGQVRLFGRPVNEWEDGERSRRVAFVSSDDHFAFPFTAYEVASMGRAPYLGWMGIERAEDQAAIRRAMELTDTWTLAERSIDQLSSGERQRVLLARALAQEPEVLLLDEPTAHLDIGHEWALFDLLERLHRERPFTIVCVLHDLALAARYAQAIALLHRGRLIAFDAPRAVLTPGHLLAAFGVETQVEWRGTGRATVFSLYPTPK